VVGGVSTAGCVGGGVLGCTSSRAAVVETRPISRAAVERSDGAPVVVAELPDGERRIVRTAIEAGTYRDCPAADQTIFLRGENPAVHGGRESDNASTNHVRQQCGYLTIITP